MYYLQKELGLSYEDIFGGNEIVTVEEEKARNGLFGKLLDKMFGKRTTKKLKQVRHKGMSAKAFLTYIDLMEIDAEEREKERKKSKMKSKMKGGMSGKM